MYFLFDLSPSLSISFLIAFLISKKIKIKEVLIRQYLELIKICKF